MLFADGVQIVQCLTQETDTTAGYTIAEETLSDATLRELNLILGEEHSHVLAWRWVTPLPGG